ncbi:hypothetical protein [Sphingomonas gellani]|uniref:hypothetical protein n=1 Tax=Sphingomonas gellani TaxID=1166340 RepID=UPI001FCD94EE|nr:hypothetical protein [Sphingomonas gellani]
MRRTGGTFGIPAVLAVASGFALVAGLLGDGAVDVVAWIGLALPLIVTARAVWHPRPPGR